MSMELWRYDKEYIIIEYVVIVDNIEVYIVVEGARVEYTVYLR